MEEKAVLHGGAHLIANMSHYLTARLRTVRRSQNNSIRYGTESATMQPGSCDLGYGRQPPNEPPCESSRRFAGFFRQRNIAQENGSWNQATSYGNAYPGNGALHAEHHQYRQDQAGDRNPGHKSPGVKSDVKMYREYVDKIR